MNVSFFTKKIFQYNHTNELMERQNTYFLTVNRFNPKMSYCKYYIPMYLVFDEKK